MRESVPAPDLVGKPDLTPHGVESILLPAVPPQQAAADSLLRAVGEGQGNGLQDVVVGGQVNGFVAPVLGIQGVGHQEHDPVYGNLGPYDDGQVADVHGADVGGGSQSRYPSSRSVAGETSTWRLGQCLQLVPVQRTFPDVRSSYSLSSKRCIVPVVVRSDHCRWRPCIFRRSSPSVDARGDRL